MLSSLSRFYAATNSEKLSETALANTNCALLMCHHRSPTTSSCHRLSEYGRGRLTILVPLSFSSPGFLLTRPSV